MVKKKKVILKTGKAIKRITTVSVKQKKSMPNAKPKMNIFFLIALVAVLVGLTFFEITYMSKQSTMKDKKPDFVRMWDHHPYTNIDMLKVYGEFIYGIDDDKGMVIKFDRLTGKIIHILDLKVPIATCIESPDGNLLVLDKSNEIKKFDNKYQLVGKVVLPVGLKPIWMENDSENNLFVVDGHTMTVHKFDTALNEMLTFGGKGLANGKFNVLLKIFVGPNDDIYCLSGADDNSRKKVSIFGKDGKFKKEWTIRNIKEFSRWDSLAIAADGYIYINSNSTNNIYVFTNNGRLVSKFKSCNDNSCKNDECVLTFPACITGGMNGELYVYTHQIVTIKNIQY